jgi:hypothetical protein
MAGTSPAMTINYNLRVQCFVTTLHFVTTASLI